MGRVVVLDSGPLGILSNPGASPAVEQARVWLEALAAADVRIVIPEIADYEVRRELLRAGRARGLARLDRLGELLEYLPLTTAVIRRAAEFWAEARNVGHPTAPDAALDGDVILAAQALAAARPDDELVVATMNIGHIAQYVPAQPWRDIS